MSLNDEEIVPDNDQSISHAKRAKSVKLAVIVSVASKLFGFVIQFAAIPFAAAALGHGFQIYSLLANLGNIIGIANIGSGPGIAMKLTEFAVNGNESEERKWFTSGLITTAGSTAFIFLIALLVGLMVPMPTLFGETVVGSESSMRTGFLLMAVLATLQNTLVYFTNAYAGYLEDYKSKTVMMAGYALSIPAVFLVCRYSPSAVGLAMAIFGIPILAQFYLVYTLWGKDRPYLRFDVQDWIRERGVKIFKLNVLYTLNAVGSVLAKGGSVIFLSKFGPHQDTAGTANTLMQWYILAVSVYIMIAGSCWPSFSNAKKHKDWDWIARGLKRLTLALTGAGLLGGLIVGFLGVPVADLLYKGKEVFVTPQLAWLCGVVVFLAAFEVAGMFLLMAFDKMRQAAYAGLMQGAIMLLGIGWMKQYGLPGMMYAVISSLVVLAVVSVYFVWCEVMAMKANMVPVS